MCQKISILILILEWILETMNIKEFDVVLLTQKEYANPTKINPYIENILLEDKLLTIALQTKGLKVTRTHWDDESFAWESGQFALFRATWDYFHRFTEFHAWLNKCSQKIHFINPYPVIQWNVDKQYLADLKIKGINIPCTIFLAKGSQITLEQALVDTQWERVILKPAIGGAARHTYQLDNNQLEKYEPVFQQLIAGESMLLQEFQRNILTNGEVSHMIFGGKYSHAVLKKTKAGDFRVQDDFGGTVHPYYASTQEREFVEQVITQCPHKPVYARVDVMWDNHNNLCVSELELIEPELWLRKEEKSAQSFAQAVIEHMKLFAS